MYLAVGLVTMVGIMTLQVIGGFYFQDQLALSPAATARMVSFGLMFSGAAMLIMQLIQMKWLKWQPRSMILMGSLFLLVSMLLFLVYNQLFIYYFAFFLFGIGSGLMMPGFMAGASLAVSKQQQGGAAGLVAAVQGISAVITPILTTTLYQVDKHIPFILVAVLVAIMSVMLWGSRNNQSLEAEKSVSS